MFILAVELNVADLSIGVLKTLLFLLIYLVVNDFSFSLMWFGGDLGILVYQGLFENLCASSILSICNSERGRVRGRPWFLVKLHQPAVSCVEKAAVGLLIVLRLAGFRLRTLSYSPPLLGGLDSETTSECASVHVSIVSLCKGLPLWSPQADHDAHDFKALKSLVSLGVLSQDTGKIFTDQLPCGPNPTEAQSWQ